LFSDLIDELLRAQSQLLFLLLGGIVLLKVDQWFKSEDTKITYLTAFKIDYTNASQWFPGSRSASIVGGMSQN
jgi:undecaprenyl pyrophosphate phosphatase UppP